MGRTEEGSDKDPLDGVLTRLEQVDQRIRRAEAERISLLAEAFDIVALESETAITSVPIGPNAELAYRAMRAEVATTLHQSEHVIERQLAHAFTLTRDYARTFEAYRDGALSDRHTAVILEAGRLIGSGDAPEIAARRVSYETAALEVAVTETPNRLKPIARKLAEQYAVHTLDERHASARRRRRVSVVDGEDGMADLIAHLPAVEAYGIHRRLTLIAAELERHERAATEEDLRNAVPTSDIEVPLPRRCRDELRADAFIDLLLTARPSENVASDPDRIGDLRGQVQIRLDGAHLPGVDHPGAGWPRAVQPGMQLTEPAANGSEVSIGGDEDRTLRSLAPPMLDGYGPIDTTTALRLAGATPHWEVIRADPGTGTILSVDRYRPSEQMRRLLRARDEHCRFPGCRVPAAHCDIDHTIDAASGGATNTRNLAHLCRRHHTLKHHSGWGVKQRGDGVLDWTSPSGRHYRERPPSRVRFTSSDDAEPARPEPRTPVPPF